MRHAPHPRAARRLLTGAALTGCVWAGIGCTTGRGKVQPPDFVADQPQPDTVMAADPHPAAAPLPAAAEPMAPATGTTAGALAVDAMIGHVNGEAIFAQDILEPIEPQLTAFGLSYDGDAFLKRCAPLLAGRLREVLIDKLILAEAGSGLSERERQGVEGLVQARREELLRYYGQGSLAKAQAQFLAAEGIEFDEALAQYREELVVRRYLQQELFPQINVQQRDVERRFNDMMTRGDFNTEDRRVIRLMMTPSADDAQTIAQRLGDGDRFAQVAGDEQLNTYNPASDGAFNGGEPVTGDEVFGIAQVNDAILALAQGEHAGPIVSGDRHFFVMVQAFEPAEEVHLRDLQVQIEQQLRLEQWDALFRGFREGLWDDGGYTDPVQMTQKLVDIAITRYDIVQ